MIFLAVGMLFQINWFTGWVHLPGNTMQILRGIVAALLMAAIFTLSFQHGRGKLKPSRVACYLVMLLVVNLFIMGLQPIPNSPT